MIGNHGQKVVQDALEELEKLSGVQQQEHATGFAGFKAAEDMSSQPTIQPLASWSPIIPLIAITAIDAVGLRRKH